MLGKIERQEERGTTEDETVAYSCWGLEETTTLGSPMAQSEARGPTLAGVWGRQPSGIPHCPARGKNS